jgi:hypothetical protein
MRVVVGDRIGDTGRGLVSDARMPGRERPRESRERKRNPTFNMRNKLVIALLNRPNILLLEIRILPRYLPHVAPRLALRCIDEHAAQLRRKSDIAPPY